MTNRRWKTGEEDYSDSLGNQGWKDHEHFIKDDGKIRSFEIWYLIKKNVSIKCQDGRRYLNQEKYDQCKCGLDA